jgi:hypothetical protein
MELDVGTSTFEEIVADFGKPECRWCRVFKKTSTEAVYMADWAHCQHYPSGPWPICERCAHRKPTCPKDGVSGYFEIICQL